MSKLIRFFRLMPQERRLFFEAVRWCALARLAFILFPFRRYTFLLGRVSKISQEAPFCNSIPPPPILRAIAIAVGRASRTVPWKTRCLIEAIAAKQMLRRRGLSASIYLGTMHREEKLQAHAWCICHGIVLTGRQGMMKFKVVARFD